MLLWPLAVACVPVCCLSVFREVATDDRVAVLVVSVARASRPWRELFSFHDLPS